MNRIILTGNPGTGKSTILNTLVGSVQFQSGVSVGSGMTTVLKDYAKDGWMYTDTPGLEDVSTRKKAAEEISSALKRGGNIKLIFVMTLESGRLRPIDITTMTQILDAITKAGTDVKRKFTVIINKASERVLERIMSTGEVQTLTAQVCQKYTAGFVDYLTFEPSAYDYDNVMLEAAGRIRGIVTQAPFISIAKGAPIRVDPARFEEKVLAMETKMNELRNNAAESARIIRRMEEEARVAKQERKRQELVHNERMRDMNTRVESERVQRMRQEAAHTEMLQRIRQEQQQQKKTMEDRMRQQPPERIEAHDSDDDVEDFFAGVGIGTAVMIGASFCTIQ